MSASSAQSSSAGASVLPQYVEQDILDAGCHPGPVIDVLCVGLADEKIVGHLVHQETTFDATETLRRHVTVLLLTPTRLLVAHADDHPGETPHQTPKVASSLESVPLRRVRSIVVSTTFSNPQQHSPGAIPDEATLTMCWGTVQRLELEPAHCLDPHCDADHGLTGVATSDDIVVRVTAAAEGTKAVESAMQFAAIANRALAGVS